MLAPHQSMDLSLRTTRITHFGAEKDSQTISHRPQILTMEFPAASLLAYLASRGAMWRHHDTGTLTVPSEHDRLRMHNAVS